jgi:hypothetical protein
MTETTGAPGSLVGGPWEGEVVDALYGWLLGRVHALFLLPAFLFSNE